MAKIQCLAVCWSQAFAMRKRWQEEFETEILSICKDHAKKKTGRRGKKNLDNLKTGGNHSQNDLSSIVEEPQTKSIRVSQRAAAKKAVEKTSILLKQTLNKKLRNTDVESKNSKKNYSDVSTSSVKQISQKNETAGAESNKTMNGSTRNKRNRKRKSKKDNSGPLVISKLLKDNESPVPESKLISNYTSSNSGQSTSSNALEDKSKNKQDVEVVDNSESGAISDKLNGDKSEKCESDGGKFPSCFVLLNRCDNYVNKIDKESTNYPTKNESVLDQQINIEKDNKNSFIVNPPSTPGKNDNENKGKVKISVPSVCLIDSPKRISAKFEEKHQFNSGLVKNSESRLDSDDFNLKLSVETPVEKTAIDKSSISVIPDEIKKTDDSEFLHPNTTRPKRNLAKNKINDNSCSFSLLSYKDFGCTQEKDSEIAVIDSTKLINESTTSSKRGKKRKSEEDNSTKPSKASKLSNRNNLIASDCKSNKTELSTNSELLPPSPRDQETSEESSKNWQIIGESDKPAGCSTRTRTRTIVKPTEKNLIAVGTEQNPDEESTAKEDVPVIRVLPPTSPQMQRMTRTRTRELKKNLIQSNSDIITSNNDTKNNIRMKCELTTKSGKENKNINFKLLLSNDKKFKTTPLAINNLFSPTLGKSFNKPTPIKINSAYKNIDGSSSKIFQKEKIAQEKKMELMKAKREESKRKREEKEQRIWAHKKALEKDNKEKLAKLQKEEEERERLLAESKRRKEEQLLQKKQNAELMLKEAEERRLKEEEAKQARIKKQEEEKRKQTELRMKQAEEAKKLHELRLAQEAKEKEARLKEAEKKAKLKQKVANVNSYELTPAKDESVPRPPKNEDDYGLSDNSGDSTDDEKQPKKIIPKWATKHARSRQMIIQSYIHMDLVNSYFPQISETSLISEFNCHRQRNSSAVWSESILRKN